MPQTKILQKIAFIDNAIMHTLVPAEDHSILILGCDNGRLCRRIARHLHALSGGRVWGIEGQAKADFLRAAPKDSDNWIFQARQVEALDFSDKYFDAVISSLFLDYLSPAQKQKSLLESYRLLKPGGKLVIAHLDIQESIWGAICKLFCRYFLQIRHIGEDKTSSITEMITASGFQPPWLIAHYWGFVSVYSASKLP